MKMGIPNHPPRFATLTVGYIECKYLCKFGGELGIKGGEGDSSVGIWGENRHFVCIL